MAALQERDGNVTTMVACQLLTPAEYTVTVGWMSAIE
jgi:hypothetical protein